MLPGADDDMVEKQATELMYLPEKCVLSTLQRQVALATKLAGEEAEEAAENETAEKQQTEDAEDSKKKAEEEKKPEEEEKKPEEPVTAKKEKEEEKKPVDPAAPVAPAPEAEVNLSASDNDLLDALFADETPKTGAKKLSGIVKQASTGMSLDNLWALPPDVSSTFK
jgi:chromatin remodeling complex protein RSC6